jgi:hypothetical protein
MTTLRYDRREDAYFGRYLRVDADTFAAAVAELVARGMDVQNAMIWFLHEEEWSPDMNGVEFLLKEELVMSEVDRILHTGERKA